MAGAGYKLFNTGDVLTAAQVNTYLQEQAVMRFANSTARTTALSGVLAEGMMSYLDDTNSVEVYNGSAWVSVGSTGDITGVTAGTGISGGGTSGDVTITNSMATAIDAKGDLIVGTGADTFSRLAVGTNGHTLVADSGETTGLKWAAPAGGSYVKVAGTTFSAVSSFSLPNSTFTSTYNTYKLLFSITSASVTGAATAITMKFRASGTDATSNSGYGVSLGVKNATPTWDILVDSGVSYMSLGHTINLTSTLTTWDLTLANPNRAERHPVTGVATTIDSGGNGYIPRTFGWNYIVGTQYDAVTIFTSDGTISGYYSVYGLEK